MVSLSYIDFTGVERADYYLALISSTGEVFPPHQFMRLNATAGEDVWHDYYEKFDGQFVLMIDGETGLPDADDVGRIGERIYAHRSTEIWKTATPVARVLGGDRDAMVSRRESLSA